MKKWFFIGCWNDDANSMSYSVKFCSEKEVFNFDKDQYLEITEHEYNSFNAGKIFLDFVRDQWSVEELGLDGDKKDRKDLILAAFTEEVLSTFVQRSRHKDFSA
jgi:hypothetical protein